MKKFLKISFFVLLTLAVIILAFGIYLVAITYNAKLDDTKLINLDKTITFYSQNGEILSEESGNNSVTDLSEMPDHVKNAFIAIEDKRFYNHNGVDFKGLLRAVTKNISSFSLKQGASTISQQLIKNTHLTSDKTFKRKIIEMKLALELEKKYTKDQIMEMYLNTIYFGENCFGITKASKKYFSKTPSELDVNESAILAGLVKAPSYYSPISNPEKCNKRKNVVLQEMFFQGYISRDEYERNINTDIKLNVSDDTVFDYVYLAKKEVSPFLENYKWFSNKFKVYTTHSPNFQKILDEQLKETEIKSDKSAIILDNKSNVLAYSSTCGDIKRQMGSTIKPLLVYAPAIETNTIDSITPLIDEKTDFNGYSPSNYNETYYGKVDVKTSLSKSLNVCAVKVLNYTGVDKALNFIKKTDIPITDKDVGLSLALGATEKGASLSQITSAYTVFNNNGNFNSATCIEKILDENDNVLYQNTKDDTRVFNVDTIEILNDMMQETVKSGTAKKLSFSNLDLYAKTGTVGNSSGNTDAYTISYSSDYVLGFWLGNKDNTKLDNSVTGGSAPAQNSAYIWNGIYKDFKPKSLNTKEQTEEVSLDALSYNENNIEIANEATPERYKIKGLFKKSHIPTRTSTRFLSPKVENAKQIVTDKGILIELCLLEYYDAKVFREENGFKKCIYDTGVRERTSEILDINISADKTYVYSILPYYQSAEKTYYGNELYLQKIKTPKFNFDVKWWQDEFD